LISSHLCPSDTLGCEGRAKTKKAGLARPDKCQSYMQPGFLRPELASETAIDAGLL